MICPCLAYVLLKLYPIHHFANEQRGSGNRISSIVQCHVSHCFKRVPHPIRPLLIRQQSRTHRHYVDTDTSTNDPPDGTNHKSANVRQHTSRRVCWTRLASKLSMVLDMTRCTCAHLLHLTFTDLFEPFGIFPFITHLHSLSFLFSFFIFICNNGSQFRKSRALCLQESR